MIPHGALLALVHILGPITPSKPIGVAVTDSGLYVSDSHHGRVVRVASGGTLATVLDGLALPAFLGVDRDGSLLAIRRSGESVAPDGTRYATNFEGVGRIDARGRLVPLG